MKRPDWLKVVHKADYDLTVVEGLLEDLSISTVCDQAKCPNRSECYGSQTATFLILGKECTRHCRFCNIEHRAVMDVDHDEPEKVSMAVQKLGLKYVVVTSVTRDDLPDGGASHFVRVVNAIRQLDNAPMIELLIPDFKGEKAVLDQIINIKPEVVGHNIETIERLYTDVRPEAEYGRSLAVLEAIAKSGSSYVKSGLMVGLGEQEKEVEKVLRDLHAVGCEIVTIGQYLPPTANHAPLVAYVHPDQYKRYETMAYEIGFSHVSSGPLVRSSYMAHRAMEINSRM